jgi:hypothetical protein
MITLKAPINPSPMIMRKMRDTTLFMKTKMTNSITRMRQMTKLMSLKISSQTHNLPLSQRKETT